mmetsp:Transcript_118140/g.294635  ORF Transcript_118140/g.294635 Transcript_118140/m.294635 type:complete len:247 (+) Transcript_118140:456-1196(+)
MSSPASIEASRPGLTGWPRANTSLRASQSCRRRVRSERVGPSLLALKSPKSAVGNTPRHHRSCRYPQSRLWESPVGMLSHPSSKQTGSARPHNNATRSAYPCSPTSICISCPSPDFHTSRGNSPPPPPHTPRNCLQGLVLELLESCFASPGLLKRLPERRPSPANPAAPAPAASSADPSAAGVVAAAAATLSAPPKLCRWQKTGSMDLAAGACQAPNFPSRDPEPRPPATSMSKGRRPQALRHDKT